MEARGFGDLILRPPVEAGLHQSQAQLAGDPNSLRQAANIAAGDLEGYGVSKKPDGQ